MNVWHDFSFLLLEDDGQGESACQRPRKWDITSVPLASWRKKRVGRHSHALYYITHLVVTRAGWVNSKEIPFWSFSSSFLFFIIFSFVGFAFLSVRRVAWKLHCQGDTDSYTADCNASSSSPSPANDSSGADRERKPQLAAQPENPQQPNNWLWFPFSQAYPTGWLFFWAQNRKKIKRNLHTQHISILFFFERERERETCSRLP